MKLHSIVLSAIVLMGTSLTAIAADSAEQAPMTFIDIAGQPVPIIKGGLYDRFRSNPPLSVIAEEAPQIDLSWFKTLAKEPVDLGGFQSFSPNFYYDNSRITAVFTADLDRLKSLMPADVLAVVQPVQIWPGRGLVALTAYSFKVCDNDPYNEFAVSVVTHKPGNHGLGPLTLLRQSMNDSYWGYVLKLPLDSELGRVRGVVGYQLPKWLTPFQISETDEQLTFSVIDSETGELDVTLTGKKLDDLKNAPFMVRNNFTNLDEQGGLQTGTSVFRNLSYAEDDDAEAVELILRDGGLSAFIRSLDLGKLMKYEYVPEFQIALYAPKPLP